jgi:hypothetical protein
MTTLENNICKYLVIPLSIEKRQTINKIINFKSLKKNEQMKTELVAKNKIEAISM